MMRVREVWIVEELRYREVPEDEKWYVTTPRTGGIRFYAATLQECEDYCNTHGLTPFNIESAEE